MFQDKQGTFHLLREFKPYHGPYCHPVQTEVFFDLGSLSHLIFYLNSFLSFPVSQTEKASHKDRKGLPGKEVSMTF